MRRRTMGEQARRAISRREPWQV